MTNSEIQNTFSIDLTLPYVYCSYERRFINEANNAVKNRKNLLQKFNKANLIEYLLKFLYKSMKHNKLTSVKKTTYFIGIGVNNSDVPLFQIDASLNSGETSQGRFIQKYKDELEYTLDSFDFDQTTEIGKFLTEKVNASNAAKKAMQDRFKLWRDTAETNSLTFKEFMALPKDEKAKLIEKGAKVTA